MGKNIFKKSSKGFDKDAFYVLLFVCLCIVAVTAVYFTTGKSKPQKKVGLDASGVEDQLPPENNVDMVEEYETKKPTAPVINQPPATPSNTKSEKSAPETKKETAQKNSDTKKTQVTEANAKSIFKISKPVEGQIAKDYDNERLQYSQAMQQWETHEGIDISCDIGTEVKAAAEGKVVDILKEDAVLHNLKAGYGITVVVDHGNGMRTIYSNLSDDVKVKTGDTVKQGQVIGTVGDSAIREAVSIEGSHLHFAVLKKEKDEYVSADPKIYMK